MPDDYYQRYRKLTHDELYHQLMAGAPDQVDAVSQSWHGAGTTVGSLTTTLRDDLATLMAGWEGPAAREFQYRLGLIATYAQKLADEAASIGSGLSVMSTTLRQEQQQAEAPQPTAPADPPIVGVVGWSLGHTPTPQAQAQAQERMTTLVAQLATNYAVTDHGSWPTNIPDPPTDLPGTVRSGGSDADAANLTTAASTLAGVRPAAAGLAGVGGLAPAPAAIGQVGGAGQLNVPPAAPPAPATLAGAAPGLAGAVRAAIATRSGGDSGGSGPAGSSGAAMPAGSSGAGNPAGMPLAGTAAVRPADGYVIDDPRLVEDPAAWAKGGEMAWHSNEDAPPPVLGRAAGTA
jgi:uncharacterized protein YukE